MAASTSDAYDSVLRVVLAVHNVFTGIVVFQKVLTKDASSKLSYSRFFFQVWLCIFYQVEVRHLHFAAKDGDAIVRRHLVYRCRSDCAAHVAHGPGAYPTFFSDDRIRSSMVLLHAGRDSAPPGTFVVIGHCQVFGA
jgi:hypothetical protein